MLAGSLWDSLFFDEIGEPGNAVQFRANVAKIAYEFADAMMAEMQRSPAPGGAEKMSINLRHDGTILVQTAGLGHGDVMIFDVRGGSCGPIADCIIMCLPKDIPTGWWPICWNISFEDFERIYLLAKERRRPTAALMLAEPP
jgi:hypothetical protein